MKPRLNSRLFHLLLYSLALGPLASLSIHAQQQPQLNDKLLPEDVRRTRTGTEPGVATSGRAQTATEPPVIDPGPMGGQPSDAIVLFDGHGLSQWKGLSGAEAKWKIVDGVLEVNGTGNIVSKEQFEDVQVHVEWSSPSEVKGEGQGRGNSGIYLQGRYEIQVLDSYQNKTYFNGQAGALCGIAAPLVNACRKPGEWQTYEQNHYTTVSISDGHPRRDNG